MYRPSKLSLFSKTALTLGLLFLYIPIISLIIYSFNESKLVTVWGGFSTKWYGVLLKDTQILSALWLSLKIAIISSIAACVLGTIAGLILVRYKRFRGRTLFTGMVTAPMVMPEVITGLSMLLLVIQIQAILRGTAFYFERGMFTIWLGHTTLCLAYVTVIVQSRLLEMDRSLEEAAMDLGAKPMKVFFVITLPIIMPAILSGFLLSMTLSLDDLVIASFLSGPGSTTLPMVIFSKIRLGLNPTINALATILVVVIGLLVISANYLMMRSQRKREKETAIAAAKAQ